MRISPGLRCAGGAAFLLVAASVRAGETIPDSPKAIQQELKSFATLDSVLYVAAHPDDENTQLITYLARGRGYRTAYLSVTRGDGGQNELGPEFGEKLGLARTYELLAARQQDGGRQFFTRALDFGFTKDVKETLRIWGHDEVLADVVRVYRTFRPDVVIVGMNPVQTPGQHGQHVASAQLAIEAFKLAGDPKAYPEQFADGLTPWQPKRLLQSRGFGGRGGGVGATPAPATVHVDAGGKDPVTGEGFGAIASRSRGMHKTQFGLNFGGGGRGGGGEGPNLQTFAVIGGEPATGDIVDGIDPTFARFPGGAEIAKLADEAVANFKVDDPSASVPALLTIRTKLTALGAVNPTIDPPFIQRKGLPRPAASDPVLGEKLAQLDRILQACLGLEVHTEVPAAEVVPGEKLKLHMTALVRSASVPVKLTGWHTPDIIADHEKVLQPGKPESWEWDDEVSPKTPISQPYWLREEGTPGLFRVDETKLIGQPLNPPAFPVEYEFEIGGQEIAIADEAVQVVPGAPEAQRRRPLAVIPPVSLGFPFDVALFEPGASKPVEVEVTAARAGATGDVRLDAPAAWKVSPARRPFKFARAGDKERFTFSITAPAKPDSAEFTAVATVGGAQFNNGRYEFSYPHIPVLLLQSPARLKVAAFDLATRGMNIGYLPGAGDSVAENLEEMGYRVRQLTGADLTPEKLRGLDAIVIGVRAFNERKDLEANLPGLFAWVEGGGTVIAQYNRPSGSLRMPLGPYELSINGSAPALRVTDENAPVTFVAPDHPALNTPNRITSADFNGWVQERGAYFPSQWDAHYVPLLAMSDPGEKQPDSSLLVAKYGKGYYVYTGLGFFRQLPAGVPGAYRLLANLVSLGKE